MKDQTLVVEKTPITGAEVGAIVATVAAVVVVGTERAAAASVRIGKAFGREAKVAGKSFLQTFREERARLEAERKASK